MTGVRARAVATAMLTPTRRTNPQNEPAIRDVIRQGVPNELEFTSRDRKRGAFLPRRVESTSARASCIGVARLVEPNLQFGDSSRQHAVRLLTTRELHVETESHTLPS